MKDWNSKIVSVLSGANAVVIKTAEDLKAFREICARIGLDAFKNEKLINLQASVSIILKIIKLLLITLPILMVHLQYQKAFGN